MSRDLRNMRDLPPAQEILRICKLAAKLYDGTKDADFTIKMPDQLVYHLPIFGASLHRHNGCFDEMVAEADCSRTREGALKALRECVVEGLIVKYGL